MKGEIKMINWGNFKEKLIETEKQVIEALEDTEKEGLSIDAEENFPIFCGKTVEYNGKKYTMTVEIKMLPER